MFQDSRRRVPPGMQKSKIGEESLSATGRNRLMASVVRSPNPAASVTSICSSIGSRSIFRPFVWRAHLRATRRNSWRHRFLLASERLNVASLRPLNPWTTGSELVERRPESVSGRTQAGLHRTRQSIDLTVITKDVITKEMARAS